MARFAHLMAMATLAIVGLSGVLAEEPATQAVDADLDEDGKPMVYFNSIYGDEDDDDYTEEELAQREIVRRK